MLGDPILIPYDKKWPLLYQEEAEKIRKVFGDQLIDIQHIGSTSIPEIFAKPIIDIAVLIKSSQEADNFIKPLHVLNYDYDQVKSSSERHFFRKYGEQSYYVSIAYENKGNFWKRQIFFRDYLREHEEARKEYEDLKFKLLQEDQTGLESYISGKTEFVEKIIKLRNISK